MSAVTIGDALRACLVHRFVEEMRNKKEKIASLERKLFYFLRAIMYFINLKTIR
jgi:hypothetical protein